MQSHSADTLTLTLPTSGLSLLYVSTITTKNTNAHLQKICYLVHICVDALYLSAVISLGDDRFQYGSFSSLPSLGHIPTWVAPQISNLWLAFSSSECQHLYYKLQMTYTRSASTSVSCTDYQDNEIPLHFGYQRMLGVVAREQTGRKYGRRVFEALLCPLLPSFPPLCWIYTQPFFYFPLFSIPS